MAEGKLSAYTQGLFDTVIALRKEVENLRIAYGVIHDRIETMAALSDKNTALSLKEAINIEELARLSVVAADVAHKAAIVLIEAGAINNTQLSLSAAKDTKEAATASAIASDIRKTSGGG